MSVRAVRSICDAVDLPVRWDIGWRRQEIDRLLDHDHATLASLVVRRLQRWGWTVRVEVSFNHYGDRGRIDVLACHPTGALLAGELKTLIADGQDLLGGLDIKARVALSVARELGWDGRFVVPAIIVAGSTTNRRRVRHMDPLLGRYALRGHDALSWLRNPAAHSSGLLLLVKLPDSVGTDARRAGRRRVRRRKPNSRSDRP